MSGCSRSAGACGVSSSSQPFGERLVQTFQGGARMAASAPEAHEMPGILPAAMERSGSKEWVISDPMALGFWTVD